MSRLRTWSGGLLLSAGVLYLGFFIDRTQFWPLITAFTLAFAGYVMMIARRPPLPPEGEYTQGQTTRFSIGLGVLLRLALVFAFPLLSDDIYRFIWDGQLIASGVNPFSELPAYYLEAGQTVNGLTEELYNNLNSPDYYTIYPPIAQGTFTVATWLSGGDWYWSSVIMKLFLLGCEIGTLYTLMRLRGDNQASPLLYWLNPLILVEIMGNLHFEGAMIFFLLLAYYLLKTGRIARAALAFAASVAAKLLPLMLLPFLIKRLWGKPFWRFSLVLGFTTGLLFLPLLATGFLDGFGSSLDLYFRKFEFNASFYYLLRAYGYYEIGWNQIARFGPLLAKAAAVGILLMALFERTPGWVRLPETWLFAFVLYLLCATTVHPWYLGVPIALCTLTRWRFPLVWSFLIMLTYTNYITEPYEENLWLVAVEYLLVFGYFCWEWRYRPSTAPASAP